MKLKVVKRSKLTHQDCLVTLSFVSTVLGLNPSAPSLREKFIKQKLIKEIEKLRKQLDRTKDEAKKEEIARRLEQLESEAKIEDAYWNIEEDERLTVFARDPRGNLSFLNYQIAGLLKETAYDYYEKSKSRNLISKYVQVLGVEDYQMYESWRYVPLYRDGTPIKEPDKILERPLRAYTPSGYIVSLISSEAILPPAQLTFKIRICGGEVDVDWIRELLEVGGKYKGLSQWRTAQFGLYEVVEFKLL